MSRVVDTAPKWVRGLHPYEPGMPIEELERRHGIRDSIKIASNENPLGPSPRAVAALQRCLGGLHRYPESAAPDLTHHLATRHRLDPSCIVVGNGSNELIELVVRALLRPGDEAVVSEHAFAVYAIIVQAVGGAVRQVPMRGFTHDLAAMADAVTDRTRLVFVANPNNPTGTINGRSEWWGLLDRLRNRSVVVVADEAYAEFVDDPEWPNTIAEPPCEDPPVVTLRTFSKVYGLAGLRIGWAAAPPDVADLMRRVRQPFSVNTLAQVAAVAALEDAEHLRETVENNRTGRAMLGRELDRLGVPWVPSQANFLLVETGEGSQTYEALLQAGVITRPMGGYGFPDHLRVTVGRPAENERFIEALENVRRNRAAR